MIRSPRLPARTWKERKARTGEERGLPSPEDVFVAWRLWLPDGVDLAAAAEGEIARIDRHAPLSPELRRLRALLVAAIESARKDR